MQKVCSNNSRSSARFEAEGGQYALNLLSLISKATLFRVKFVQLDRHNTRISPQTSIFRSLFSSTFSKDFPSRANFQTCNIFEIPVTSFFLSLSSSTFSEFKKRIQILEVRIDVIISSNVSKFPPFLFFFSVVSNLKFRIWKIDFESNFEMFEKIFFLFAHF